MQCQCCYDFTQNEVEHLMTQSPTSVVSDAV